MRLLITLLRPLDATGRNSFTRIAKNSKVDSYREFALFRALV